VLIGDSGEKDPEIYGNIMRKYPMQIICSMIRNVTARPISLDRVSKAFQDISSNKVAVFRDISKLKIPSLDEMDNMRNCGTFLKA